MKDGHIQLESMIKIMGKCFQVLKSSRLILEDEEARAALTLLESCCQDLVAAVISMGEELGEKHGTMDRSGYTVRAKEKAYDSKKTN
jgi:hypothetical protein